MFFKIAYTGKPFRLERFYFFFESELVINNKSSITSLQNVLIKVIGELEPIQADLKQRGGTPLNECQLMAKNK